jgi:hypothetical protein
VGDATGAAAFTHVEDTIAQSPSFSEASGSALRSLDAQTGVVDHCAHPRREWTGAGAAA